LLGLKNKNLIIKGDVIMKTKRLSLNKTTVANLDGLQMRQVYAGVDGQQYPDTDYSCPICIKTDTCPETMDCPITSSVTNYTCDNCGPIDPTGYPIG
jgi:hypothetical protein